VWPSTWCTATESSKAKLFASEAAVRAANNALQVFGGYGYIDEYPAGKLLRDARVITLYEGTSQFQKLLIGRALTGGWELLPVCCVQVRFGERE